MTERGFGDEECDSISPHVSSSSSSSSPLQTVQTVNNVTPERQRGHSHSVLRHLPNERTNGKPLCHPRAFSGRKQVSHSRWHFAKLMSRTFGPILISSLCSRPGTDADGVRELLLRCYLRARSLLWGVVKRNEECWLQHGERGGGGRLKCKRPHIL